MREWAELFVSFALLTLAVALGVILAHTFLYVFSVAFWVVTGF